MKFNSIARQLSRAAGATALALALAGCPAVQTVPGSSNVTGTGTTATGGSTQAGSATLSWTAPTQNTNGTILNNLMGYHIHYGTSPTAMSHTINVTSGSTTRYVVSGLASGYTYYFTIAAYNSDGIESAPSNTASKTI